LCPRRAPQCPCLHTHQSPAKFFRPGSCAIGLPPQRRPSSDLIFSPRLRAFALSLTGHHEAADDLVQDTLLRALQKRHRFEPRTNLQAWLFTMLRNRFYSDYRMRRREVEDAEGLYAAKLSIAPEQPGCVAFAALRSALLALSDDQREAVLLVGAEGLQL
jgi:RNA polymerase sigma-70 factor (ECF subfamily)